MKNSRDDIRNVAIIAHVDHGKTTLVDELLKQSGTFRSNQNMGTRIMDNNDIEKERGITILSKNTSVNYKGTKINIVDTPGHADFGGEVERVLKMVNGVILVVDAFEGAMPQTKFVLRNALKLGLSIVICINKIDREEARIMDVEGEILDLFLELDANDNQLDSPFIYASARNGYAQYEIDKKNDDLEPLFETIIKHIAPPQGNEEDPCKLLISTIDYSEYTGRIGIGKIEVGTLAVNDIVSIRNFNNNDVNKKCKITSLYEYDGLERVAVEKSKFGSIVAITGIEDISIGDTVLADENDAPIEFNKISEPTLRMTFSVNDSPFAGLEGKYVTSRHLRERLYKELQTDVSLKVEDTDSTEEFRVFGRGELHLSILIENMRREGYEFQVAKPEVRFKEIDGVKYEPIEILTVDVPEDFTGNVIEKLGTRKGEMTNMVAGDTGTTRMEFKIPARGLIGYRGQFLTDTKGTGVMNSIFNGYEKYKGEIQSRKQGSIVAFEDGESTAYGLFNAKDRGTLFIGAGVKLYQGMCVGINARADDMVINVCKKKQLTNTRASGSDDSLKLTAPKVLSLEEALEFIGEDELVEVTPENIRVRKKILDSTKRMRSNRK